ncbi:hypothetical protein GGS26DRAFT_587457 [Hypomontagnella submonticulosa]|nr:hypothetical protein GGS26DRAFT_587457 [Hypomontagnella submonticulosa]
MKFTIASLTTFGLAVLQTASAVNASVGKSTTFSGGDLQPSLCSTVGLYWDLQFLLHAGGISMAVPGAIALVNGRVIWRRA